MRRVSQVPARCGAILLAIMILSPAFFLPGFRARAEGRVLKVAFPEVNGFSETDEHGVRHGIIVDYLNEIAKYTGWKYEYIDTDDEDAITEFAAGKYDLLGGAYYQPALEEFFAYPDYNTGFVNSILLARRDDERIRAYEWNSMNGMTIGVYDRAGENIRRLEVFLQSNGIHCALKRYSYEQLSEGSLYTYLESGEVDMLLGNGVESAGPFRVVAEFDSQPHYIVTKPGNQEVLDGLNMALAKIMDSNPNFAKECYDANFPDSGIASIALNAEEKAYIRQKETVSVAVARSWHPLYCMNSANDLHNGLIPDVLKRVEDFTGLKFTLVETDSYAEALALVRRGGADMLGAFLGTEADSMEMDLALTKPYGALNDIIARNKSVSFPSEGLVGAVLEGRRMSPEIETAEIKCFPDVAEALWAVNRGEVDFFYGLSTRIEQVIQEHHYTNVVPNTLINDRNDLSFAVTSPAEAELLTVLNKAISSLSSEEKTALANKNMISTGIGRLSLIEAVYANPVMFVAILGGICALVVVLVLVMARSRVHAAEMRSSLEKAEAASRAKGEFLSRMSHEIRTPMNAIVGLSDLTDRMPDVPEAVRENLSKIRASSNYLLSLISDILDMSRIESGMMTIASEPFSLRQMVEELRTMMAAEAQRRSLQFAVEEKLGDDTLMGDAVRLKQVLANLLSNAFKFTPAGGRVLLRVAESGRAEGLVTYRFQVIDNGVGISEENQRRIFEAFEQVGSNYAKSQGTGLGLAISYTIVGLMGGELQVKSEVNRGSEFFFSIALPIGAAERPAEAAGPDVSLEGVSILLAEDNDLNADIAMELLSLQGASVRRAENGQAAVQLFRDSGPGEFQVILMDIQMPVMDGLEACRAIRAMDRPDAPEVPIIAMTANSFQEDADAAAQAGMNGFVTKPIDVEYLYRVLRKVLSPREV